ncbi:hypothetical protein C0J52_28232 [Blattella germanica]|nr:hypothetical protein C0J52_28232 [Blattella germanica]
MLFPGIVTGINPKNQEIKVSCIQRGLKGSWKWPKEKDELFYGVKDVIEKVDKSYVSKVKYIIDKKDKDGEYRPTSYKSDNDEKTDICPLLVSERKKCTSNSKKIQLPCRCPVLKVSTSIHCV